MIVAWSVGKVSERFDSSSLLPSSTTFNELNVDSDSLSFLEVHSDSLADSSSIPGATGRLPWYLR